MVFVQENLPTMCPKVCTRFQKRCNATQKHVQRITSLNMQPCPRHISIETLFGPNGALKQTFAQSAMDLLKAIPNWETVCKPHHWITNEFEKHPRESWRGRVRNLDCARALGVHVWAMDRPIYNGQIKNTQRKTLNMLVRVGSDMQSVLDVSWKHPSAQCKHTQQQRTTVWTEKACLLKQYTECRGCFWVGYNSKMRCQNEEQEYNVQSLSFLLQHNVHTLNLETYKQF